MGGAIRPRTHEAEGDIAGTCQVTTVTWQRRPERIAADLLEPVALAGGVSARPLEIESTYLAWKGGDVGADVGRASPRRVGRECSLPATANPCTEAAARLARWSPERRRIARKRRPSG